MKAHGGPQSGCISLVSATQSPPSLRTTPNTLQAGSYSCSSVTSDQTEGGHAIHPPPFGEMASPPDGQ